MKSEIVSTGTELLLGQITDTNSSYVASELPLLGIDLFWISQVGDNKARMVEVLKHAWERSDLIITTGGLGPSEGDITRSAIAAVVGEKISIDPKITEQIAARFRRYGREMTPSNIKQASIIPSAKTLPNTRGTAPGWWVEKEGRIIVALPGPPDELHNMWQTAVLPRLKERVKEGIIVSRIIKTWGVAESAINDTLLSFFPSANPTLAIYVKVDGIHIRLTAKAESEDEAGKLIAATEKQVKLKLAEAIWGYDQDTMEGTIAAKLREKGLSLAVVETFTGGELTSTILGSPEAPPCFKGAIALGSMSDLKALGMNADTSGSENLLPKAAEVMARRVKRYFNSEVGLSVSGEVSRDKSEEKPYDTVCLGLANKNDSKVITLNQPRDRIRVKRWVVSAALFELIKMLTRADYFPPKER